ncbi:MAG TPA: PH domain-containing protein, partial [Jatrophihabitans sp.]|nr:PH domain-containing protein [Jatrophihabitans sp.]
AVPYPEKILADDEQVVERLHPHWITLVPATFWFLVICALAGLGIGFAPSHGTTRTAVIVAVIVLGFVLLCWLSFGPWIRWRTTHYIFTTHRVLIRRGVLRHTGRDISLQRINDVGFTQSLWDRMVRAGTLTIESAGEHGQEELSDVPRSDQMQQALNRLIEQDGDRRARQAYGGQGYAGGYPPQGPPQAQYPQQPPYPPTQQYPPQG